MAVIVRRVVQRRPRRRWVALCVCGVGRCLLWRPEAPRAAVGSPGSKRYIALRGVGQSYQSYSPQQTQQSQITVIFAASGRRTLATKQYAVARPQRWNLHCFCYHKSSLYASLRCDGVLLQLGLANSIICALLQ